MKVCFVCSEDQWDLYLDYITSVFRLVDSGSSEVGLETGLGFISRQQEKHQRARGPFLAEIELQTRNLARSGDSSCESGLCDLLVKYFERFGSKPACALDLKLYLPSIGKESVNRFFDETSKIIDVDENQIPKSVSCRGPVQIKA